MGHARLSPSGAKRWMTCPASVEFCRDIPDTTSEYAQEGTNAHFLINHCIETKVNPEMVVDQDFIEPESGTQFKATREMVDAIKHVFTLINNRYEANVKAGGKKFIVHSELKVFPLRLGRFDIEGTTDVAIETDSYVENIDYKHGAGVAVEVQNNRQMQIYGVGTMDTLGTDELPLVTTIVQPRAQHPDGIIRSVLYQPADIAVFTQEIAEAAARTDDPNAPFNPVDEPEVCGWCRGKATCKAIADKALEAAQAVFSDISQTNTSEIQQNVLREPKELSLEQVRMILENASLITGWVGAVQKFAKDQMLAGIDIPGFKLIAGRRSRKWDLSEEELEKLLRSMKRTDRKKVTIDDVYERKVRTPAGMEKTLKGLLSDTNWGKIKEHIVVSEGSPQIAPATSSKPAISVKAEEVFKDVSSTKAPTLEDFL